MNQPHAAPDIEAKRSGPDPAFAPMLEMGDAPPMEAYGSNLQLTCAALISPEKINWLWLGYVARGKFTVLAGTAGTGKTTIALSFTATVTSGSRWPDGSRSPVGKVVIWSGEDDPADTLVPRLIALGADLRYVYFVGRVADERGMRAFDPASDIPLLAEQMARLSNVALLIVDPIVSAVAADSHKNGEVRRGLQPLVDLAAAHDCALLGISHYTKGTTGRDPLERVTGSLAFGALARCVLGTAKPTEEGARRRLVRAKSNIGPDGGGFEYDLEQVELEDRPGLSASRLVWRDAIAGTARDLLAEVEKEAEAPHPELDSAREFLLTLLSPGPLTVKEIEANAKEAGHAWATVRRAKADLGAFAEKAAGQHGAWSWRLNPQGGLDMPPGAPGSAQGAQ